MLPSPLRTALRGGFTLIEMSIVLIIIGLILGGVLAGREMVLAAEINSVVADVNRIKTSVATFKLKYSAWPGDMPNATRYWAAVPSSGCPTGANGTCNGNGDSNIDVATPDPWLASGEMHRAWQHLSLASMVPGNFTGVPANTTSVPLSVALGRTMMTNKIGGFYALSKFADPLHDANAIRIIGSNPTMPAMEPGDARAIDTKLDDGRPGTGMVTGDLIATYCTDITDPQTAVYNMTTKEEFCNLASWFE